MTHDVSKINFNPVWKLPTPRSTHFGGKNLELTRQDFYNEYYVTGHKIFDPNHFPDIEYSTKIKYQGEDGKIKNQLAKAIHKVNRIGIPIQDISIDIILSHFLGNKVQFDDISIGEKNPINLSDYKKVWEIKNMESHLFDFVKSSLSLGDSAMYFYKPQSEQSIKVKVFSYFNGDELYVKKNIYGEDEALYRKYTIINDDNEQKVLIDVIDKSNVTIYNEDGTIFSPSVLHGMPFLPFEYHKRMDGAFWSPAQTLIDNLEVLMSRLSEDNRTKTKPKYFIKANKPSDVQKETIGSSDVLIGSLDSDFKMIQGSDISTAFEFEHSALIEYIFNTLGLVYPKHKSSGDMPTGSMKMMFFPTERIVMQLIHEYNEVLDSINEKFKMAISKEYPGLGFETLSVGASFRLFTPQDEQSYNQSIANCVTSGILSLERGAELCTYGSSDNYQQIVEEKEKAAEEAMKMMQEKNVGKEEESGKKEEENVKKEDKNVKEEENGI